MIDSPKRTGYRLTYDAECLYNDWQELGGCSCHTGCAPCSSCTHDGHPILLEENDEAWELDDEVEDMARDNITDKSSPPKSEWFGFKYRVTSESSKLLQEAVFEAGGDWGYYYKGQVAHTDQPFLIVREGGEITFSNDEHYFETCVLLPEKQPPQPVKKVFVMGKYYKCVDNLGKEEVLTKGKYYYLNDMRDGNFWTTSLDGSREGARFFMLERFDINSESDYDPNAKKVVDTEVKESKLNNIVQVTIERDALVEMHHQAWDLLKHKHIGNNATTNVGDTNMSTNTQRKTVTVNLIDRDTALDEKFALVATFGEFTTSKSSEALIRSIIIDPKNDVAKLIAQHNEVRTKQTNKEILDRTGNKVTLEAVEESDLHWEIR